MIAFKNIVLTTDLSSNADAATPYAAALAKLDGGTIHLFHAFEEEAGASLAAGVMIGSSAWVSSIRKQREEQLAALARRIAKTHGVNVVSATAIGHPAKETAQYVKNNRGDIVVTATHGRTGVSHLLLGSVAERIVRLSPAPVLTVRPGEKLPEPGFKFRTILLPTDFSVNSAAVRLWAVELARWSRAKIVLAHVVEDSVYYASAAASEGIAVDVEEWMTAVRADADKQLQAEALNLARETGLQVEPVLTLARADEQIDKIAQQHTVELTVISTHGYTGLSHLVFGSIAEKIVRGSPVPVLSIK